MPADDLHCMNCTLESITALITLIRIWYFLASCGLIRWSLPALYPVCIVCFPWCFVLASACCMDSYIDCSNDALPCGHDVFTCCNGVLEMHYLFASSMLYICFNFTLFLLYPCFIALSLLYISVLYVRFTLSSLCSSSLYSSVLYLLHLFYFILLCFICFICFILRCFICFVLLCFICLVLLCFVCFTSLTFRGILFLWNFSPAAVFIPAVKYSSTTWKCKIAWLQRSQQLQQITITAAAINTNHYSLIIALAFLLSKCSPSGPFLSKPLAASARCFL